MPRHVRGDSVYVSMRVYDPITQRMKHVRGMTVIFEKFTPDEVFKIIVAAGREAHERGRREREHGEKQDDGCEEGDRGNR